MKTITKNILLVVTIILAILYSTAAILLTNSSIDQVSQIINALIISLISICFATYYFYQKKINIPFTIINTLLIVFLSINILSTANLITLPTQKVLGNLTQTKIFDTLEYAEKHGIKTEIVYENSETVEEYKIISQDVDANTLLSDVKIIKLTVSSGKDLNKTIIVPNMIGWDDKKVLLYVTENSLSNVSVKYTETSEKENTIISQNKKGEMKRNDEIVLTFARNKDFEYIAVPMINLKNKSLFEATLWASKNGITIKKEYEFNDSENETNNNASTLIKKGRVLDQDKAEGELLELPEVLLTISKGSSIKVPNLKEMTIEEIAIFATKNKLKVEFTDKYDTKAPIGTILSTNVKTGDILEEGKTLNIVSSKGQLKMEEFKNIEDFRTWANKYKVPTSEIFQSDEKIKEDEIIKFSHTPNTVLKEDEKVTVYISKGKASTIPNITGKTLSSAISMLRTAGLGYGYSYSSSFSNAPEGTVISQSIISGTRVDRGTKVTFVLSKGSGVTVPYLVGKSKSSIQSICNNLGLKVTYSTGTYSKTAAGCATRQSYSSGSKVNKGTVINVTLSKGPAKSTTVYIQPNWVSVGNPKATASNISAKLKAIYSDLKVYTSYVKTSEPNKAGLVASSPNITITQGSSITIKIYTN